MNISKLEALCTSKGYELVAFCKCDYDAIVLVSTGNPHHPFVTWRYGSENNAFFYGHYFATLGEAKFDFMRRIPPEV